MAAATFEPPLRPRAIMYGVSSADKQFFCFHHVDKAHRHADDKRGLHRVLLDQLMQPDERGRGVADGEDQRAVELGRVLH